MDIQRPCFLFFDYDGTVFVKGEISTANREAMLAAQKKGHQLILCTGRAQGGLARNKEYVTIPWDGIIYGGADILYRGSFLETHTSEPRDAFSWIGFGMRKRCRVILEGQKGIVPFEFQEHPEPFTMKERFEILHRVGEILKTNPITKFTVVCVYPPLEDLPKTEMNCIFHPTYTEVFPKGCDKGEAIKAFCRHLGIELSQCACFGDSMNDYPMFRVCPTGVCMKNSPAALCEISSYCAKEEDGVAEGLRWLGLAE